MMSDLLPLLYIAEERREQNFRDFFSPVAPSLAPHQPELGNGNGSKMVALDKALVHLLETGRFSDMQFLVGVQEYRFNCHKAIVGGRSEVLAIAMEQRWAEESVTLNKTVVRLPETDVDAFKVFLKYLYSDQLNLQQIEGNAIVKIDLLLKVMALSHLYEVEGLLKECVTQLTPWINVRTCWVIYKESRLIAPSLSEKSFKFLCDNIHEAAARHEYLKWDGETVGRILSLDRSFISELNLFQALLNWQKQRPANSLQPSRKDIFEQSLLPLIRFPSMNLAAFSNVIKTNALSQSECKRLRRYITNPNPGRRNTSIYSNVPRFVDIHPFKLLMSTQCRTTACSDDGWNSSDDNFITLIESQRAEFSIGTNSPAIVSGLMLHNVRKWSSVGIQCRYNLSITFYIYIGESVMYKEEQSLIIGGSPSLAGASIPFILKQPFQLNPARVYEFHVLYTLLEDDEGMANENESYTYKVTWNRLSPMHRVNRSIGHGIAFKVNYKVEGEDDDDDIDHNKTPRWIQSVDFKGKVSQSCQQFCTVS